ncbi:MAG: transposase, partial [Phycisphaeraceae bacterium JB051]
MAYCHRKECTMPRQRYNQEFRLSAVRLVTEQGYTINQAAQSLSVDASTVRVWVKKFGPQATDVPEHPD